MMKLLTASCSVSLANSQLIEVIKNNIHLKLQILTKFKPILRLLLIENLQASIWSALLMFTVLICQYRAFRVTLAGLQKEHKFNFGSFFL